jgi:hypothetical protein
MCKIHSSIHKWYAAIPLCPLSDKPGQRLCGFRLLQHPQNPTKSHYRSAAIGFSLGVWVSPTNVATTDHAPITQWRQHTASGCGKSTGYCDDSSVAWSPRLAETM